MKSDGLLQPEIEAAESNFYVFNYFFRPKNPNAVTSLECVLQAADLASRTTESFLESIRDAVGDRPFAEFLGLADGATLCFIIDTTGSMGGEIAAVRRTTIDITQRASTGNYDRPSDYVLAPFNDAPRRPTHARAHTRTHIRV